MADSKIEFDENLFCGRLKRLYEAWQVLSLAAQCHSQIVVQACLSEQSKFGLGKPGSLARGNGTDNTSRSKQPGAAIFEVRGTAALAFCIRASRFGFSAGFCHFAKATGNLN